MKKVLTLLLALLLALGCALLATACGEGGDPEELGGETPGVTEPEEPGGDPEEPSGETHAHTMTAHPAAEAGCETEGNTAYWSCTGCGKYFADAAGKEEIAQGSWVIPATGHAFAEAWAFDGAYHWHACQNGCGKVSEKGQHDLDENSVCRVCKRNLSPTEGLDYTLLSGGSAYAVSGLGSATDTDIVIPAAHNNLPVISISYAAFRSCDRLTSITIPNSVTSIGSSAFNGCSGLTSITIGDGVASIGDHAFSGCSGLTSITIPDSVTSIYSSAFYGCTNIVSATMPALTIGFVPQDSLQTVVITSGTSIDDFAFRNCSGLNSITLPDSITSIGDSAFRDCSGLASIIIGDGVTSIGYWAFYGTAFYNEESNWENEVLYIGNHLIKAKMTISGTYTIKAGTKTIADRAFYGCDGLTSITIPHSVTSIGEEAFSWCDGLTSITIPDSVTSIGYWAFYNCSSLASITIPDSVTSIEREAFLNTAYYNEESNWENEVLYIGNHLIAAKATISEAYTIKSGTRTIADSAFYNCIGLTSITIPDSVTSIDNSAFYACTSLTSITIPNSVTSIGISAFSDCSSLTAITIGNGVTSIGNSASYGCNGLTEITIGNGVTSIGYYAFYNCSSLASIIIPSSVTFIGSSAFRGCSNLAEIIIPDSVTSIEGSAFSDCSSLDVVYYTGTAAEWEKIEIGSNNGYLTDATRYYYSEEQPTDSGNYWRYVDGVPTPWETAAA